MRVLITGGNGYIARSLYSALADKHCTTKVTRADFNLSDSKQTNAWFQDKSFDAVIHTAIVGGSRLNQDDSSIVDSNLRMYYNLVANKDRFHRLISFGSGAEKFAAETPYGMSKKIIADSIRTTDNFYNLRIFAVFSENELDTRFIKSNIIRYKRKKAIEVHCNKIMDFFYMEDLITLVDYYLSEKNPPKEINCNYEEKKSLVEISNIINNSEKHKVNINLKDPNILEFYCGPNTKLPLKYIGLEKGIEKTFNLIN